MCELFGICSREPVRANDWLRAFYEHSDRHPDGWGLAVFRRGSVTMEKEPVRATESRYLKQRLSRDIVGKDLFAHIRRATIGQIEYANCHPFVWDDAGGRTWTMIHNGSMFDGKLVQPYSRKQEGTTDSERVLLFLLDAVDRRAAELGEEPGPEERFHLLDDAVGKLAPHNKLNLLLYDGEILYVHTNCRDTLFFRQEGPAVLFATKPFGDAAWEPVPMCRLLAYRNGIQVRVGAMHGQEYVENEEDMISLFAAFAEL